MKNYPLWKSLCVFFVIIAAVIFTIPSIIYSEDSDNWFLNNKINLGLDLQGGSYLLLQVESDVLINEELEFISDTVRQISRKEKINLINITSSEDQIIFEFRNSNSIDNIKKELLKIYRDINILVKDTSIKVVINENFKKRIKESAIKQSLEIVRKRIDESGTKEPLIQRSGKDRILLQ